MTAPVSTTVLEHMAAALLHRGPDDGGVHVSVDGQAGIASRRLSIIDLTRAGHMPMLSDDGAVAIAYNGEIYNFRELRLELRRARLPLPDRYRGTGPRPPKQRKAGFGAPIRTGLRRDLREMVDDLLCPERIRRRGFFEPAAIRRLVEDDRRVE